MSIRCLHKGFVLVEVVIVALIVGILAAVAIPIYTGYVQSQRREVVKNIASAAAAAANIYYRRTGSLPICTEISTPSIPNCITLLNIFLTEPLKYSIGIQGNDLTVYDLVHPEINSKLSIH